jgi:cyclase
MSLAKRIIPTMLVRGRTLVKGKQFAGDRSIGHVLQAARVHAARGVDELCILDIGATAEGRGPDLEMVRELSDGCFIPITVGGGVKSLQDIDALLRAGADKVCIGAAMDGDPGLLTAAAERFGRQALVVALDVAAGVDVRAAATKALAWRHRGAGEILLQSVERDGMMCGYDLGLIRAVSSVVSIPVIASGGCSSYKDMHEAFIAGADACAVGALFAFSDETPRGAARWLKSRGVEVRL